MKKFLALFLTVTLFSASLPAIGAEPEHALTVQPEDSIYFALRLDDASGFLKWLASDENINAFMPLVLSSEDSNDIIGGIEIFKTFAEKTPIKSAVVLFRVDKDNQLFTQIAFTVNDEAGPALAKIADGTANDGDFARILLGNDSPLSAMFRTMLKAEKLNGDIYRIDTGIFVKVQDGVVVLSETLDGLKASLDAMSSADERLFSKVARKFSDDNFALFHVDYDTLCRITDSKDVSGAEKAMLDYFDKPLNFEFAFNSKPDKFIMSLAVNIKEAANKKFLAQLEKAEHKPEKGSYMKLAGAKNPLAALGGFLRLSALKDQKDTEAMWKEITRQVRVRFGISEEDFTEFLTGPFSLTVNDSVTFEGMKIPAIYISQTGNGSSASNIFSKLSKSPHFQKIQDGILQIDSSLSPVSCLVRNDASSLEIDFAELSNISASPVIKPALKDLTEREGISAFWIDFEAIREWIISDENGVLAMSLPMAKMMGYGDVAESVRDVLTAEFSVPSFSVIAENSETFIFEFANVKINPENGLISKIVKAYQKFSR